TAHTALHGKVTQKHRIAGGIKMKGISNIGERRIACVHWTHKTPLRGCLAIERIGIDARHLPGLKKLKPVMIKLDTFHVPAHLAERVQIALANMPPIDKLNTEFECSLGL